MKKIAVIGATISGNRGAESMLSTVVGRIHEKFSGAVFNVYSYYPDDDKKICSHGSVNIYSATPVYLVFVMFPFACLLVLLKAARLGFLKSVFPKGVLALDESDVLIDISGVSFMSGRVKFIPFNILTIFPAMILGIPVIKFSQALGPFNNPLVCTASRIFLPACTRIFARGNQTSLNLQALGLDEKVFDEASDLAFLHKKKYSMSEENLREVEALTQKLSILKERGKILVGLCPSSVIASKAQKEGWNYAELLYIIVRKLSNEGFAVLLFPNATREKSVKLRNNDLPVIEKTARYLSAFNHYPDDMLIVTKDINSMGIKTLLEYCDLNIVSRFHAMIASLVLEKPVVVMGWGHKYQEIMDQFDLGEFVFDYKDQDLELLLEKVFLALNDKEKIANNIRKHLPEVQKNSYRQFDFLFELFQAKE